MSIPQALRPPELVLEVARAAAAAGGRALLVGGCVRDHLTGHDVKDWDLEVYGLDISQLEGVLRPLGRVDTVGKAFSVLKIKRRRVELDVSIPRRDSHIGEGHRGILAEGDPSMSPEAAARRRDLTVNAILLDPLTGQYIDPYDGRRDVERRTLRAVDADTFLEDPLRALRAVQFAARLDFEPTQELVALCAAARLDELPSERILGEWTKLMLKGRSFSRGFTLARAAHLFERVTPELSFAPDADQVLDAARQARDRLSGAPRRLVLMMSLWMHEDATEAVLATLDRLNLHRWHGYPVREAVLAVHGHHRDDVHTDAALRWLSTRAEVELALLVREHGLPHPEANERRKRAAELSVLHEPPPRILQGRDFIQLGVKPGPRLGDLVQQAYEALLDGQVHDRPSSLELASRLIAAG